LFYYAEFSEFTDPVAFEQGLIDLIVTDVQALRDDALAQGLTDDAQQLEVCLAHCESLQVK
jgi:hypothetical protein